MPSDDRTPDARREAERGGYVDACPECRRYVATTGASACPKHYVPAAERPRDPGPDGRRAA